MSIVTTATTDISERDYYWLIDLIQSWLHRSDLAARIPEFITLAESEINTDMRLRLMESDESLTLASGATTVALPARYSEPIRLDVVIAGQDNRTLTYLTPQQMGIQSTTGSACEPDFWTINGANIQFPAPADQQYTLLFRMLGDFDLATTGTNALLIKYPGMYLYGALLQASIYTVNDERVPGWRSMYESLKDKANRKEARTRTLTTLRHELPGTGRRNNIYRG